jgi:outer membrane receptor for ferrienterochelin and colicins
MRTKIITTLLLGVAAPALMLASAPALAEDDGAEADIAETGDAPQPVAAETAGGEVYTPADFERFAPRNALDMLNQVPGFRLQQQDQGRGLGQASENVLINGERLASKSDSVLTQLSRIAADRVVRIEIVDGATFGIPGLSGQVANVITTGGAISGRFEYRAVWRPKYARTSYGGGEISLTGTSGNVEWTGAYSHGTGRGGAGGGRGTYIYDGNGNLIETHETLLWFKGEFPRLSGRMKWNVPGGTIVNLSATVGLDRTKFNDDEYRVPVTGVPVFRDFLNVDNGYTYDFSGDVDFAFGPGRLKLIGIERFTQSDGPATFYLIPDDGAW